MGLGDVRDVGLGAFLQCCEAATLGMPFEVWKTQQISNLSKGANRGAITEFKELYKGGIARFYHGLSAKLIEAASKGAILLWGTHLTLDGLSYFNIDRNGAVGGLIGGFFGGIIQTVVMSPMTYVVTYKNRNPIESSKSSFSILRQAGFRRAFGSAPAMAGRQGTNWALRWFFAQGLKNKYKEVTGKQKLNAWEEIMCGLLGGAMGCINQPFEVVRVLQQARQATGDTAANTRNTISLVYKKYGLAGFYAGIIPRMGLSAWQTLFMVTFAGMIKDVLNNITPKDTPIA